MLISTGLYLQRSFEKSLPDGTTRQVNDVVHLKEKIAPTKFRATVVGARSRHSEVIDICTLEGAVELKKHEFEELVKSL